MIVKRLKTWVGISAVLRDSDPFPTYPALRLRLRAKLSRAYGAGFSLIKSSGKYRVWLSPTLFTPVCKLFILVIPRELQPARDLLSPTLTAARSEEHTLNSSHANIS